MGIPLQTFLLQFGTEGLAECAAEISKTEKEIDRLEKKEKELRETIKKGGEEAEKAEAELKKITKSLKEQKEHLTKLQHSWQGTLLKIKETAAVATKIIGSFAALGKAIKQTMQYAADASALATMAEQAGTTVDKFQDLRNAVKRYGGSTEDAAASLAMFNDALKDIKNGGDGGGLKEISAKYRISTNTADANEFFENIAAKMDTLKSQAEKNDLGKALGLDEATIKLLSGGLENYRKELEKVNKYKVFTKEDIERSRDFEMTMRDISMGASAIGANLAQLLLPALTYIAKQIRTVIDFFVEHAPFIKMVLTGIGLTLIPFIIKGIGGIGKALFALLKNPVLAIIAGAILLISLLLDDLYAWLSGGEARFGAIWKALFGPVEEAREKFKQFYEGIKVLIEMVGQFCKGVATAIGFIVTQSVKFLKRLWDTIPDPIKKFIGNGLKTVIKLSPVGMIGAAAKGIYELGGKKQAKKHKTGLDYVPYNGYMAELHEGESVLTKGEANVWRSLLNAKQAVAATSNVPFASIPQGVISNAYNNANSTKSINIGDITIQTAATNAEGIASELAQSIKRAIINLDDGMLA